MYFSLIEAAPGHERDAAHERATGPYEDHQWLWKFFPAEAGTVRDHLFRRLDAEATLRFYVLSRRAPVSLGSAWSVRSREYAPQVQAGDRLRFDLRANPVVTHDRDGKRKRHDVVMQAKKKWLEERGLAKWEQWEGDEKPPLYQLVRESCSTWLSARAQRLGFAVDGESLAVDGYAQHRGKRGQIRISTVDFSGQLTVTDPVALKLALFDGIGHAKAFGCGLLLVRRVTD